MTTRSAESFLDSYKTELIADRVWRTNAQLELATVDYLGWFNHRRLHSSIGNRPPVEHEREYWPRLALGLEPCPAQAAPTVTDLRDVLTVASPTSVRGITLTDIINYSTTNYSPSNPGKSIGLPMSFPASHRSNQYEDEFNAKEV